MKKLWILIMMIFGGMLAIPACGDETLGGEVSVTNYIGITNFATITLTNTPDASPNLTDMASIQGEWLVTFETYLSFRDVTNTNGDPVTEIYIHTNTATTISNFSGVSAYTFMFKSDQYVDKINYNTAGEVLSWTTNLYKYYMLSNENGQYIELVETATVEETVYINAQGVSVSTNEYELEVYKTNFTKDYTVTNVSVETVTKYSIIVETNNIIETSEKSRHLYTYEYSIVNNTNMAWSPNTIYTRSTVQVIETIANGTNGSGASSKYLDFTLNSYNSLSLQKVVIPH